MYTKYFTFQGGYWNRDELKTILFPACDTKWSRDTSFQIMNEDDMLPKLSVPDL